MKLSQLFGIIDIGSNSVRMVIYEDAGEGIHRVVEESKKTIRLIDKVTREGQLPIQELQDLLDTLIEFQVLCKGYNTAFIRSVATAAIRNAINSEEVVAYLTSMTGLTIEVASEQDEARYGFIGVLNAMAVTDGFLIDIGGGSTEISLFRNRSIVHTVSFPFGAVNTAKRYAPGGASDEASLRDIRVMTEALFECEPWLKKSPGLPMIGLGGTIRTLAKLVQRRSNHSLPIAHNYQMSLTTVHETIEFLAGLPLNQRVKVEGLAVDRADIIVPGLVILQNALLHTQASHSIVSGAGLREGVYYETVMPGKPFVENVLEHSVANLLRNASYLPARHTEQVHQIAMQLFDGLQDVHKLDSSLRACLYAASKLYRIGTSISYYCYPVHTFYLMTNARINGLTHREIVLSSLIASYTGKKKTRKAFLVHQDLLTQADLSAAVALGSLLQLAAALDSSRSQRVQQIKVQSKGAPTFQLVCSAYPQSELTAAKTLSEDFRKVWRFPLVLTVAP
ncbi:MAG: Ppx/GppA family phosphatase [Gorillibacterium sp.]|nr:Ppx/GppA family phosphatase [Gorillibacterium sp.]